MHEVATLRQIHASPGGPTSYPAIFAPRKIPQTAEQLSPENRETIKAGKSEWGRIEDLGFLAIILTVESLINEEH